MYEGTSLRDQQPTQQASAPHKHKKLTCPACKGSACDAVARHVERCESCGAYGRVYTYDADEDARGRPYFELTLLCPKCQGVGHLGRGIACLECLGAGRVNA